jgi:hypothetical protein
MAKSIPVDVIREMKNHIDCLDHKVSELLKDAKIANIKAETLNAERNVLEKMVDTWTKMFPGTEKE